MQQGAGSDVGNLAQLHAGQASGKSSDDVFINHLGSFVLDRRLVPGHTRAGQEPRRHRPGQYRPALPDRHQRANRTPTIQVGYDGSRAAVGDVVALFEGNTVLARKVLTSDDIGPGNKTVNLTVAQSLAAGEHDIVTRHVDTAGNTVVAPRSVSRCGRQQPGHAHRAVGTRCAGPGRKPGTQCVGERVCGCQ
jgi:hypothetical protein